MFSTFLSLDQLYPTELNAKKKFLNETLSLDNFTCKSIDPIKILP